MSDFSRLEHQIEDLRRDIEFLVVEVLLRLKWPKAGSGYSQIDGDEKGRIELWYEDKAGRPLAATVDHWRSAIATEAEAALERRKAEAARLREAARQEREARAAERREGLL